MNPSLREGVYELVNFWDIREAESLKPEEHLYPELGKQTRSIL